MKTGGSGGSGPAGAPRTRPPRVHPTWLDGGPVHVEGVEHRLDLGNDVRHALGGGEHDVHGANGGTGIAAQLPNVQLVHVGHTRNGEDCLAECLRIQLRGG